MWHRRQDRLTRMYHKMAELVKIDPALQPYGRCSAGGGSGVRSQGVKAKALNPEH